MLLQWRSELGTVLSSNRNLSCVDFMAKFRSVFDKGSNPDTVALHAATI